MRKFWPIGEAAQADYERLRAISIVGGHLATVTWARFERRGLAGLISWPASDPVFTATILGAVRPAWTGYVDPRLEALAGAYELTLACGSAVPETAEAIR